VPETYVHRIGRTARAGASGIAISFCDEEETGLLRDIEKLIRKSVPVAGGALPRWATQIAYPPPPKRGSQPRHERGAGHHDGQRGKRRRR
jgi:ATP-dependent RNA helicase RhlE